MRRPVRSEVFTQGTDKTLEDLGQEDDSTETNKSRVDFWGGMRKQSHGRRFNKSYPRRSG